MDEHNEMVNRTGDLRHACESGRPEVIGAAADHLEALLTPHAQAEEAGLFLVLSEVEEFAPTIERLIGEHRRIDVLLADVRRDPGGFTAFEHLLRDHIDREDNGLFRRQRSSLQTANGSGSTT